MPGREVFAGLLFAFFDRNDWWNGRKKPWRRLSGMISDSEQNVERWVSEGAMPSRELLRELDLVIHVPVDVLEYTLRYNRLPENAEEALASEKARMHAAIDRLPEQDATVFLPLLEAWLEKTAEDTRHRRGPKPEEG